MPATYDTLPLDARLAGVLDGWTGPVDFLCRPGDTGPGDTLDGWECAVWHHGGVLHPDRWTYWPAAPLDRVRLPLHRPEPLHRLADWLAAGERCSLGCTGAVPDGVCPRCGGTGYLRPPSPAWWALPRALGGTFPALWSRQVLGWSAESVGRGGKAIRGIRRHTRSFVNASNVPPVWAWVAGPPGYDDGPRYMEPIGAMLDSLYALAPGGEDEPLTLPPLTKE